VGAEAPLGTLVRLPSSLAGEPFDSKKAQELARAALGTDGVLSFSGHALKEMEKDGLATPDVMNVIRAGWIDEPAEEENGTYRYRFKTNRMCVVIAFRSPTNAVVVTAWRLSP
jgi:hypothetical protein